MSKRYFSYQAGMSIVEIMVGVLIGMIAIIVMFQVLSVSESRKRSTTGAGDLQTSGSIAMYLLDRDIRAAGFGFATAGNALGCNVAAYDATRTPTDFTFPLVPALINQTNGAAGPDTIIVLSGNSSNVVSAKEFSDSTADTKIMQAQRRFGFLRGDMVIATAAPPLLPSCTLLEITDNTNPDSVTLVHAQAGTEYTSDFSGQTEARFNRPGGPVTAFEDGKLFNLGGAPRRTIWTVSNGTLTFVNDFGASSSQVDAGSGVINMKAAYGIDSNDNNQLEDAEWVTVTPTTPEGWGHLMAIRISILVRGDHWDREHCSLNPQYQSGAGAVDFVMNNVNGGADAFSACTPGTVPADSDPNNWRNYRYRVYESVVPLKNMLWGAT